MITVYADPSPPARAGPEGAPPPRGGSCAAGGDRDGAGEAVALRPRRHAPRPAARAVHSDLCTAVLCETVHFLLLVRGQLPCSYAQCRALLGGPAVPARRTAQRVAQMADALSAILLREPAGARGPVLLVLGPSLQQSCEVYALDASGLAEPPEGTAGSVDGRCRRVMRALFDAWNAAASASGLPAVPARSALHVLVGLLPSQHRPAPPFVPAPHFSLARVPFRPGVPVHIVRPCAETLSARVFAVDSAFTVGLELVQQRNLEVSAWYTCKCLFN